MYKFICKFCENEIIVEKSTQIGGHVTTCKSNPNREKSFEKIRVLGPIKSRERSFNLEELYYKNPKKCVNCDNIISYDNKNNKFCNHSCSATYTNKRRPKKEKKEKFIKVNKTLIKLTLNKNVVEVKKNEKTKKYRIIWNCPVCNKNLELTLGDANKRKYCSGTCRNKINNQLINGNRSKAEMSLELNLKKNFTNLEMSFNNRVIMSGNKELDVYVPSLQLAIEWNGIYHYKNFRGEEFLEKTQKQDSKKVEECKEKHIELYVVKDLTSSDKFIRIEIDKIIEYIQSKLNGSNARIG